MEKKKKHYESPDIKVTQVELESSICSGSIDIQNPNSDQGRIQEHTINTDFSSDSFNSVGWTEQN